MATDLNQADPDETCGDHSGWHDDGDPMDCTRPEGHDGDHICGPHGVSWKRGTRPGETMAMREATLQRRELIDRAELLAAMVEIEERDTYLDLSRWEAAFWRGVVRGQETVEVVPGE